MSRRQERIQVPVRNFHKGKKLCCMIMLLNTKRGSGNHMKQINEGNMSFMHWLGNVMFCVLVCLCSAQNKCL